MPMPPQMSTSYKLTRRPILAGYSRFEPTNCSRLDDALEASDAELVIGALREDSFLESCHANEYAEELVEIALSWLVWDHVVTAGELARTFGLVGDASGESWDAIGLSAVHEFDALLKTRLFEEHVLQALRTVLTPNATHVHEAMCVLADEKSELLAIVTLVAKSPKYDNLCSYWVGPLHSLLDQYESPLDVLEKDEYTSLDRQLCGLSNSLKTPWHSSILSYGAFFLVFMVTKAGGLAFYALARLGWWLFSERGHYNRGVRPILAHLALGRGYGNQQVLALDPALPQRSWLAGAL